MSSTENKKVWILTILKILERYSDEEHPLTQARILSLANEQYGQVMERRAVSRNVASLKEAGYEIVSKGREGVYLKKDRNDSEYTRILLDSVMMNPHLTRERTGSLTEKLEREAGPAFCSHLQFTDGGDELRKSGNEEYYRNLEVIAGAISERKCLEFEIRTQEDGKKVTNHPGYFSPAGLVPDGYDFLVTGMLKKRNSEETVPRTYRLEQIYNIRVTQELRYIEAKKSDKSMLPEHEPKFETTVLSNVEEYEFLCDSQVNARIFDYFGHYAQLENAEVGELTIMKQDGNTAPARDGKMLRVKTRCSFPAAAAFVYENIPYVSLIGPDSAVRRLERMTQRYQHLQRQALGLGES